MHFHGPESVRLHLGDNENITGVGKGELCLPWEIKRTTKTPRRVNRLCWGYRGNTCKRQRRDAVRQPEGPGDLAGLLWGGELGAGVENMQLCRCDSSLLALPKWSCEVLRVCNGV